MGVSADMDASQGECPIHKVVGVCPILPFLHQTHEIVVDSATTHDDFMGQIRHKRNGFSREDEVVLG